MRKREQLRESSAESASAGFRLRLATLLLCEGKDAMRLFQDKITNAEAGEWHAEGSKSQAAGGVSAAVGAEEQAACVNIG